MLKATFVDPVSTDSDHDICWHNLITADKYHNLELFIAAARAWCLINPDKNYQDLERELRNRSLYTHIIASQQAIAAEARILFTNSSRKEKICKYHAVFSCRPEPHALQELLTHWNSYSENFDKLCDTGDICISNDDTQEPSLHKFSDSEKDFVNLIANNKKKIIFQEQTVKEYVTDLDKYCRDKFQKSFTQKLLAITQDGAHVYVFTVDNKIISPFGLAISNDETGEHQELVNLRSL